MDRDGFVGDGCSGKRATEPQNKMAGVKLEENIGRTGKLFCNPCILFVNAKTGMQNEMPEQKPGEQGGRTGMLSSETELLFWGFSIVFVNTEARSWNNMMCSIGMRGPGEQSYCMAEVRG
jgi:hypothetical protein